MLLMPIRTAESQLFFAADMAYVLACTVPSHHHHIQTEIL